MRPRLDRTVNADLDALVFLPTRFESLDGMPDRERTVLSLYYYEGFTLSEIGSVFGVSESRARTGDCVSRTACSFQP